VSSNPTHEDSKRSIVIWYIDIFCNGQADCDDDHIICVEMTSTNEQRRLVWIAFVSAAEIKKTIYYVYVNFWRNMEMLLKEDNNVETILNKI
jgi:hypothetical protein